MTMTEARAALNVPAAVANNNCVQDGQWRLRDAIKLATACGENPVEAPSYVVTAVNGLRSWVEFRR